MTSPTRAELDGFAARLRALEAELEQLQRRVAEIPESAVVAAVEVLEQAAPPPEPTPPTSASSLEPVTVPEHLRSLAELFAAGRAKEALREADRLRGAALKAGSTDDLAELLVLLGQVPSTAGVKRLSYAVEWGIDYLRRVEERRRVAPFPPANPPAAVPAAVTSHAPASAQPSSAPTPPARLRLPRLELSDLLGPRALAIAGGIVTLLGIVFFFVLAVNRGWIGPTGRVGLGGGAAVIVFLGGLELRRRYGDTHSALAAVGAGVAGGYATLLAAAALYDMLPDYGALLAAAAIAATGLVTSLAWRSQVVAGLGLVGAILVPVAVVAQGGLSVLGTWFAVLVFAATAIVAILTGWRELLVFAALATVGQVLALAYESKYSLQSPPSVLAVAAGFAAVCVGAGIARQLRAGNASLDELASSFTLGGGVVAVLATLRLFATSEQRGLAMLAIAIAYAAMGAVFFARAKTRDLSALLTFATFTLGAFALAELLSGRPLVYAWAGEAAGLSWLARRVREPRFQLWSTVYLALVLVHVLTIDARPTRLFTAGGHPAAAAPAAVALAAAAAVFSIYAGPWRDEVARGGGLSSIIGALIRRSVALQLGLRRATAWGALVMAVYAASLWTLALVASFGWGWVAVSGLWGAVGVVLLVVALRRPAIGLEHGSLIWIGLAGAVAVLKSLSLAHEQRAWSLVIVAVALLAGSLAYQIVGDDPTPSGMDVSAFLAAAATVIGAFGTGGLLDAQPLAYVWAAQAVGFAWLARRLAGPHLRALALVVLALLAGEVLIVAARPRQLLEVSAHPAHGALSAVAVVVAAALVALQTQHRARRYVVLQAAATALEQGRANILSSLVWGAGAFSTYALSLATLALMASFAWANVALAGIWTGIGVAIFGTGVRRGSAQLLQGGLIWLGLTGMLAVEQGFRVVPPLERGWEFVVVAGGSLVVGVTYAPLARRARIEPAEPIATSAALISLGLLVYPIATLLAGRQQGAALLGLAALYAAIAAALFRRRSSRDMVTVFWSVAIVVAAAADAKLLDGTYAVLGWAAGGSAVALLARRSGEPRLHLGAAGLIALTLGRAVIVQARPSHLFVARVHPAYGSAAVLIAAAALALSAYVARSELGRLRHFRNAPWWVSGVLTVYALSLLILEIVERLSDTTLHGEFQRGHTAVSAFWGLLGLALLYVGLKVRLRSPRVAGLVLFAVSLAKIFLYDLPALSSIERALSFLAVGAVLLLGGFFYQRASTDRPSAASEPSP